MAPRRHVTWRTLTAGLAAIAGLVIAGLWVLIFARVGALHGQVYHLYMLANDASRIIQGTEVWLAGQKVGLVSGVQLRPVSTDAKHRVAIELEVLRTYQPDIRADSRAQLRHAGSPIGAPVIMLSEGTPEAPALEDGDTILATQAPSSQELAAQLAVASRQVPHLVANVHAIAEDMNRAATQMETLPSTRRVGLDALVKRASERIASLTRRTRQVSRPVRSRGHPGGESDGLLAHATKLATRVDSVTAAASSGRGTVARLQRDTTLRQTLADVQRRITLVGSLLAEPRGSAGRFLHDGAIAHQLHGDGHRHEGEHEERDR